MEMLTTESHSTLIEVLNANAQWHGLAFTDECNGGTDGRHVFDNVDISNTNHANQQVADQQTLMAHSVVHLVQIVTSVNSKCLK